MRDVKRPQLHASHRLILGIFGLGIQNLSVWSTQDLKLESGHVDSFVPDELLVVKKLHPLVALLLCLEKLKVLHFFHLRSEAKPSCLFAWIPSFYLCTKLEDEFLPTRGE